MILDVLVLGLAVFGLTELVKLFLPFAVLSQIKGLIVLGLAFGLPWFFASGIREGLMLGASTVGFAILLHALAKAVDAVGETHRIDAMTKVAKQLRL